MTKVETAKLLAVLAAAYPRFESNELKTVVWHELLGDLEYSVVQLAVKKCILKMVFPPTIAEVRAAVVEILFPDRKTAGEGWGEVTQALKKYGQQEGKSAFKSMSPLTVQVVKNMGWWTLCNTRELGIIQRQFFKIYEQLQQKEQEKLLLPQSLRDQIVAVSEATLIKKGKPQKLSLAEEKELAALCKMN